MHPSAVVKFNVWRDVGCLLTFVSDLDHCSALLIRRGNKQSSSIFFPHSSSETSTFSGVSLKTLVVLTHRRLLRPKTFSFLAEQRFSQPPAMACVDLPYLLDASCNGSRAKECVGRPGNHSIVPRCERRTDEWDKCVRPSLLRRSRRVLSRSTLRCSCHPLGCANL